MPPTPRPAEFNSLLKALPAGALRRMMAGCETVELAFADVLYEPPERLSHVYFPTQSFISLIMPVDGSASLEVGPVGNEGIFGQHRASRAGLSSDVERAPPRWSAAPLLVTLCA